MAWLLKCLSVIIGSLRRFYLLLLINNNRESWLICTNLLILRLNQSRVGRCGIPRDQRMAGFDYHQSSPFDRFFHRRPVRAGLGPFSQKFIQSWGTLKIVIHCAQENKADFTAFKPRGDNYQCFHPPKIRWNTDMPGYPWRLYIQLTAWIASGFSSIPRVAPVKKMIWMDRAVNPGKGTKNE